MALRLLFTLALSLCVISQSHAGVIYTGSDNPTSPQHSARAEFSLVGTTLTLLLTNTSTVNVLVPSDVLTGILFKTTNTLTPMTASLPSGSVAVNTNSVITNVDEGWGYRTTPAVDSSLTRGFNSVLSATGAFTGLGQSTFSTNSNTNLGGLDYGIVDANYNSSTTNANQGVTKVFLVKNSVQFTFAVSNGFSLSELGNTVNFQYGTNAAEKFSDRTPGNFYGHLDPPANAVPEPGSIAFMVAGALGMLGYRVRNRRSKSVVETV